MTETPAPDLQELLEFREYVSRLPPPELCQGLKEKASFNIGAYWFWLGQSLEAFFSDKSDPLWVKGLTEEFCAIVQGGTHKYLMWSAIIFQGERFLKSEAQERGINYPFHKRSDLLKCLALEECQTTIWFSRQECWESYSEAQRNERASTVRQCLCGVMSKTQLSARKKRWAKEDTKLSRDNAVIRRDLMPWTYFCGEVFEKYRKKLPGFEAWADAVGILATNSRLKKFAFLNGELKEYPGRGKGKNP